MDSRFKIWERNLLDLSLRNVFLNFRGNKGAVQIFTTDELIDLENALCSGTEYRLAPAPEKSLAGLQAEAGFYYHTERAQEADAETVKKAFEGKRLLTCCTQEAQKKMLLALYRESKNSMEENGANTLYLALGFLRWYEDDKSDKERLAPLVLYPIDITRKIHEQSYSIKLRDEDPQMNVTLLEMLHQNYGMKVDGLDELPYDDQGVDLSKVYENIAGLVSGMPRFEIVRMAFLGIFSFGRFIMWNDLKNRKEDLMKNRIVESLEKGYLTYTPENLFPSPEELDCAAVNEHLAVPLSADASQLTAVVAAARGSSFVLHGPPGTGKSQTITNIIANALYQGKSVLFVADKMSALSVVQKRLTKIGLGPFCLELHSNKARKRDVLEQLERTLELGRIAPPGGFEAKVLLLQQEKDELNEVMNQLHMQRPCGYSLYELVGLYESYSGGPSYDLSIPDSLIEQTTPERFAAYHNVLNNCVVAAKECGDLVHHPFRLFSSREYNAMLRDDISTALKNFLNVLSPAGDYYRYYAQKLNFTRTGQYASVPVLTQLLSLTLTSPYLSSEVLCGSPADNMDAVVRELIEKGRELSAQREHLLTMYQPEMLTYDYKGALERLNKAEKSFFLFRGGKVNDVIREIRNMVKQESGITVTKENVPELFANLKKYHDIEEYIQMANPNAVALLGSDWKGCETDFEVLSAKFDASVQIRTCISKLVFTTEERNEIGTRVAEILKDRDNWNREEGTDIQNFAALQKELTACEDTLRSTYGIRMDAFWNEPDWFTAVGNQALNWRNHISELRDWVNFQNTQDEAIAMGLGDEVSALLDGAVPPDELSRAFYQKLTYRIIMKILQSTPALSRFHKTQFESLIDSFKKTEEELNALLLQEMASRLSANLPNAGGDVAASSEVATLKKAIKSGGKRLSIRKLFEKIPGLLHLMCPCMLMSPISVAQFIDPAYPMFDLVVFDEASQLPTCEAVGAIARGRECVVVGDPKQLPPTSFFKTQFNEEEFEEVTLESLLDDCLALSMPECHLLWHYRSKHESLIAFSNRMYYEDKLYTFPTPGNLVSKVSLVQVDGVYERGGSKRNVAEAEALVDEIVRRVYDDSLVKESIGVVTFSLVQQLCVQDVLEERIVRDEKLDERLALLPEPIFIKNLENVQGDERDVILFSVGYGPDEEGKVSMNFGPLNADGGWRRLNVAITRSRTEMIIFSVLKPEQIDLSRTKADGVAGLKGFLEFARSKKTSGHYDIYQNEMRRSRTEQWIASFLTKAGYKVHCGVGASNYKMDIAVCDPENKEQYMLGIMCDGAMYKAGQTAHDRNVSQPAMLQSLGWNLYRAWVLEWLDDPEKQKSELFAYLEGMRMPEVVTVPEPEPEDPQKKMTPEEMLANMPRLEAEQDPYKLPYQKVSFATSYESEDFYKPQTLPLIVRLMDKTLTAESPIAKSLLYKRICGVFHISKMGSKVYDILENAIGRVKIDLFTEEAGETFLWKTQPAGSWMIYRYPAATNDRRDIEEIPLMEISNAVYGLLRAQYNMTLTDLSKAVAKYFGYIRMGESVESRISDAILLTNERGLLMRDVDQIHVTANAKN